MASKAQLLGIINTQLASNQPILASQHRAQIITMLDELYNAQSRGNVLSGLPLTSLQLANDTFLAFRNGAALQIPFSSIFDDPLTLGTPNGLELDGTVLSLGLASATTTGALSSADFNIFSAKEDADNKGQPNGYAQLDSGAKIPISLIPDSVLGQVEYQGTWNAATNTPTLPTTPDKKGEYYVVSTAGTFVGIDFEIGDWIISNGVEWEKVNNTDAVRTVFGRLGDVVANANDYNVFYVRHDTNAQGLNNTQKGNARTNINAEPTFTKNTGFNKNFGTAAGTVAQGNDVRLSDARVPLAHTHVIGDVTGLQTALDGKENAFAKNTGFNKNFGAVANTVTQGNDARLSDARTPLAHTHIIGEVIGLQTELNLKAPLASPTFTGTVSGITKSMVGLGNVDNTSDLNKPISTATQTALNAKENTFTKNTGFNKNFGTAAGTVAQGNDPRLSDARVPLAHTHIIGDVTGLQSALDGKENAFTKNTGFNKNFGAVANTVTQGNDARLSNARVPLAHTHGNITNAGAIGSVANLVAVTGTNGVLTTASRSGIDTRASFPPSEHDHDERYYTETELDNGQLDNRYFTEAESNLNFEPKNANIQTHILATDNPHGVTKSQVGLGSVDNTSDVNKPISAATQTALNTKENAFAKNTGFNKNFGTVANTVTQGNDSRLSDARVPLAHTHVIGDVIGLQTALDSKENAFAKNTAFNKNFGTTVGTVAQGNDSRFHAAATLGTANGLSLTGQELSLGLSSANSTGALSSTDFNIFNAKVGGSGTTNFLSKFTASGTIGNSAVFENGGNVGIGTNDPSAKLDVVGGDAIINGVRIGIGAGDINTNTRVGRNALVLNTTGSDNTAIGRNALLNNSEGSGSTAIGRNALINNTTGGNNTANGFDAGSKLANNTNLTVANDSIFIGRNTKANANNQTNQIVIGNDAVGAGNNSVVLGHTTITKTVLRGDVGIGTTTPGQKLSIVGLNATINSDGIFRLSASETTVDTGGQITFANGGARRAAIAGRQESAGGSAGYLQLGTRADTGDITERMRITAAGNVGIGIDQPSEKLQVSGGNVRISGGTAGSRSLTIQALTAGDTSINLTPSTGGIGKLNVNGSFPLALTTNGTTRLTVTQTGNIIVALAGIPTSDPIIAGQLYRNNIGQLFISLGVS